MSTMNEIRNDDGTLPSFAWPGGYAFVYIDRDGDDLCAACARMSEVEVAQGFRDEGQTPHACYVHWEGEPLVCSECNDAMLPEYEDD